MNRATAKTGQSLRGDIAAMVFLALFCVAQGYYATELNKAFYKLHGPFFDSLAYNQTLASVLLTSKTDGILSGMQAGVNTATVALPFLLAAFAGPFVEPSRAVGVWLQVPWIFALLGSAYALFRIRLDARPPMAAVLALPFASIAEIYDFNGGLSDFRMDLHLYLFFGCAVCWFIVSIHTKRLLFWIFCGIFCGLAALARATSPVYLIAVFAPALLLRLVIYPKDWPSLLRGCALAALLAALVSAWFFIHRYHDLYYYYVVWNLDANAHLPLAVSVQHFLSAANHIGMPMFFGSFVAVALSCDLDNLKWSSIASAVPRWPWETILAALMPAGFLAVRGAGINNPYVSMPSTFGMLAVILCLRGNWGSVSRIRGILAGSTIIASCAYSAYLGYAAHTSSTRPTDNMAGLKEIIRAIRTDAGKRQLKNVRYTAISLAQLCNQGVQNVLIFDKGFDLASPTAAKQGRFQMDSSGTAPLNAATYVEWLKIPGSNDEERIAELVKTVGTIDYVVMPTDATLKWMEKYASHNYVNNYSRWLKQRLLHDLKLAAVSEEIEVSPQERYVVYANLFR